MTDAADIQDFVEHRVIESSMRDSARSAKAKQNVIGVSDLGVCREQLRRMFLDEERTETTGSSLAAFVGTAVGALVEEKWKEQAPEGTVRTQVETAFSIDVRGHRIEFTGHPDLVTLDAVIDIKTKDGLSLVRNNGSQRNHRWQVAIYLLALQQHGDLPEDAKAFLCYIDRAGNEATPYVEEVIVDDDLIFEMTQWLDDVIYAIENSEEASKDKDRWWCERFCPFVADCRSLDTDVTGMLVSDEAINGVLAWMQAQQLKKELDGWERAKKKNLDGLTGFVSIDGVRYQVRQTTINREPHSVKASSFVRIDVKRLG